MAVYNDVQYDARVVRSCKTLGEKFEITLFHSGDHLDLSPHVQKLICFRGARNGPRALMGFWYAFLREAMRGPYDLYYVHDYYLPLPGALASLLRRRPLIYDAHELIIPEENQKQAKREKFFYLCEKLAIKGCDVVLSANPERSQFLQAHYRLSDGRASYVRNLSDYSLWREDRALQEKYRQLADDKRIKVIYQGDLSYSRGIQRFVDAVVQLPPEYALVMVGGGDELDKLRQQIDRLGINGRVILLGKVPSFHLPTIQKMCHIGIVSYPYQGLNNLYCASNKFYDYAYSGLGIVATAQAPLLNEISGHDVGESIAEAEGAADIANKIVAVHSRLPEIRRSLSLLTSENNWSDESSRLLGVAEGAVSRC